MTVAQFVSRKVYSTLKSVQNFCRKVQFQFSLPFSWYLFIHFALLCSCCSSINSIFFAMNTLRLRNFSTKKPVRQREKKVEEEFMKSVADMMNTGYEIEVILLKCFTKRKVSFQDEGKRKYVCAVIKIVIGKNLLHLLFIYFFYLIQLLYVPAVVLIFIK